MFTSKKKEQDMSNLGSNGSSESVESVTIAPNALFQPQYCHDSGRIRAFLRLSRIATDDTIRQHLNEIKQRDCESYLVKKIFPQWEARSELIDYCFKYSKNLRNSTSQGKAVPKAVNLPSSNVQENETSIEEQFDLRTDPYAYKSHQQQLESQFTHCDMIDNWVKNEQSVEQILRQETIKVFNDKCYQKDWTKDIQKFR